MALSLLTSTLVAVSAFAAADALPPGESLPSVAVLPLTAKGGVEQESLDLVTTAFVDALRRSRAFGRVASLREMETAVGFERMKQLSDCDSRSCMAEIAGALGVAFIMTGEVGKLGASYVLNCSIIQARTATSSSSVNQRLKADSPEALLDAVEPATRQLLAAAAFKPRWDAPAVAANPAKEHPAAAPVTTATAGERRKPSLAWLGLAAVGAVVALTTWIPLVVFGTAAYWGVGVVARLFVLKRQYSGDVVGAVAVVPVLLVAALLGVAGLGLAGVGAWRAWA